MKIFILLAIVGFVLVSSKPFRESKREKRAVCSTTTYDKPEGNIVSHGDYGLYNYMTNQDCTYIIKVESPSKLFLNFHQVALEGDNPSCPYDYVKIVSTNEIFCGDAAKNFEFDNIDSDFTIKFHSDSSVQFGGFIASYRIEPLFQAAPFIANTTANITTSWPNWNTTTPWPNWNNTGNSTGNHTTSWPSWNTTTSWPNWNNTGNSTGNTTASWPSWNTTTPWPNWNNTGNSTGNTTASWPSWNTTTSWPNWNNTGNSTGNTTTSLPSWNTTTSWPNWNNTGNSTGNTTTSWPNWNTTTSWPSWNTTTSWPSWNTTTSWPNWNITGNGTFPLKNFSTLINMLNGTYVNVLVLNYQGYNNVDL
ncbi:probable ATP-dependent RNA helicase ddx42 [Patella vulgata]|uniref:probable ATP-dependent RNA helicase ddx42 n=1 Tax=Patella vulgata TaxID=6465 RepID=UPI0024A7C6C1|nr:probable ATP-dependent RNA helicase ddx42 [Patella vulgata]